MTTATEKPQTLANAKARIGQLEKRIGGLMREQDEAARKDAELAAALEARRAAHREGKAKVAEVRAAERALEEHRREGRHVDEAIASVREELSGLENFVSSASREAERARQEEVSAALRKRADELVELFVTEGAVWALQDRVAIAAELRSKFPLATSISPIPIADLVRRFGSRGSTPPPFRELADRILVSITGNPAMLCDASEVERQFGIALR